MSLITGVTGFIVDSKNTFQFTSGSIHQPHQQQTGMSHVVAGQPTLEMALTANYGQVPPLTGELVKVVITTDTGQDWEGNGLVTTRYPPNAGNYIGYAVQLSGMHNVPKGSSTPTKPPMVFPHTVVDSFSKAMITPSVGRTYYLQNSRILIQYNGGDPSNLSCWTQLATLAESETVNEVLKKIQDKKLGIPLLKDVVKSQLKPVPKPAPLPIAPMPPIMVKQDPPLLGDTIRHLEI